MAKIWIISCVNIDLEVLPEFCQVQLQTPIDKNDKALETPISTEIENETPINTDDVEFETPISDVIEFETPISLDDIEFECPKYQPPLQEW